MFKDEVGYGKYVKRYVITIIIQSDVDNLSEWGTGDVTIQLSELDNGEQRPNKKMWNSNTIVD